VRDSEELSKKLLEIERREREVSAREARATHEAEEVVRLRAIIESEAERSEARATALRTELAGTRQGQGRSQPGDEKPKSGAKPRHPGPEGNK
jgi:hypothetical protein